MSEENVATVRRIHDAYDRKDIAGFLGLLDEAIEFDLPAGVPYGGRFEGRAGVGRFFPLIAEYVDGLRVTVHELIDAGEVVVDLCTLSGRGTHGGSDFEADGAFVWRFRGGKPVAMKEYSDTARIRAGLARQLATSS